MKKFITHLRKRWLRYGLETLVVVNGVLIAFALNNWNENRKLGINQNESLDKLKSDLVYDITRLDYLDSTYKVWIEQADFIIQEILSGKTEKLNSVEDYVVGRGSMNHITIQKTTLNEMINTGIFYKISNRDLTQSINDYYETANFELTKLDRDNQNFADFVLSPNKVDVHIIALRLIEQHNLEYLNWEWLRDRNSTLYRELEVRTLYHKGAISANQLVIKLLKEKAEIAIKKINDHQQKLK